MIKKISLAVLLLLIVQMALAQQIPSNEAEIICGLMQKQLNAEISPNIPNFVPFSDEIVNLYLGDSSSIGYIIIENKKMISMECTENNDATFNVYIESLQTLYDIQKGESRLKVLVNKLDNDEINVEGTTITKKLAWFMAKAGMKIGSWFA